MLWILGVILFLLMVVTGFMGYVLPWGQMSFWAATVITNLFSAIPLGRRPDRHLAVGRLCRRQSDAQPLLLAALPPAVRHRRRGRAAHLGAAHGRAEQSDRRRAQDREGHGRVHALRDRQGRLLHRRVLHLFFAWFVFYIPNYLGHPDNYIPANPGQTPPHIVPEWYYLPFYAILRAIPNKLLGVIALGASIVLLAFLPWLDTSRVRSAQLSAALPAISARLLRGRHRARLSRLAAAGRRLCDHGAHPHRVLFRLPARHPAAARPVRDDEAVAELDLGIGAARRLPAGASAPPPSGAKA